MANEYISPIGGLTKGKLQLATAVESDVLSGKTFYGGDSKVIRTGSLTTNVCVIVAFGYGYTANAIGNAWNQQGYDADITSRSFGAPRSDYTDSTYATISGTTITIQKAGYYTFFANGTQSLRVYYNVGGTISIPSISSNLGREKPGETGTYIYGTSSGWGYALGYSEK